MRVSTTFRGLEAAEVSRAGRALERGTSRLERLVEEPTVLRAVFDGDSPEHRVVLSLVGSKYEAQAQCADHDLETAVNAACERLRVQLVRHRRKQESLRHRRTERLQA